MKERREGRRMEGLKGADGRERVRERILSQMWQDINEIFVQFQNFPVSLKLFQNNENKKESRIYVYKEWLKYLLRK